MVPDVTPVGNVSHHGSTSTNPSQSQISQRNMKPERVGSEPRTVRGENNSNSNYQMKILNGTLFSESDKQSFIGFGSVLG